MSELVQILDPSSPTPKADVEWVKKNIMEPYFNGYTKDWEINENPGSGFSAQNGFYGLYYDGWKKYDLKAPLPPVGTFFLADHPIVNVLIFPQVFQLGCFFITGENTLTFSANDEGDDYTKYKKPIMDLVLKHVLPPAHFALDTSQNEYDKAYYHQGGGKLLELDSFYF